MDNIFNDENVKQFSKLLFEISKSLGGTLFNFLKRKNKNVENFLYEVSTKYLHRFYKRFGHIQVLGMNEPMSLTNVCIDICILDSIANHKYLSIENLKKSFENDKLEIRNLQNKSDYKLDGLSVVSSEQRIVIVGPPGGGKSTYLRKIGIECLSIEKKSLLKNLIPILIELKNIDSKNDLYNLILQELIIADFPNPSEFLESALKKGKLIFLFDGLDEIATEFESKAIKDIKDFCDRYSKNKFVVSCRTAAYKGGLNNFKNFEIATLDKDQIQEFISKWFQEKNKHNYNCKDISEKCWEKINSPEFSATLELAQSPLLLTLLCLVYNYQQDFPKNRALLYREAINVLLKEWNAEKRIHNNAIYKDMTIPFEELLLSHIAHHYFIKDEYFFEKKELSSFISEYIGNNLNAPKYLDGSSILDAISLQQGILTERAKNIFSFSHLTFQEFFTAKYIDDYGLVNEYVKSYLLNPKWREIFILLCGVMKTGSDNLLSAIFNECRKNIENEYEFVKVLSIIDVEVQNNRIEIKYLSLILILIISTNYRGIGLADWMFYLLKEMDAELYDKVSSSWIMDFKPQAEMHYNLYIRLLQNLQNESNIIKYLYDELILFNNHKVTDRLKVSFSSKLNLGYIKFTEESILNINYYFKNLVFLYHCKKSSILVTKRHWEVIENGILVLEE